MILQGRVELDSKLVEVEERRLVALIRCIIGWRDDLQIVVADIVSFLLSCILLISGSHEHISP